MPSWWRLFWHVMRWAASRTFCTAGSRRPIRIAMMAITTRSSMRVKAPRPRLDWVCPDIHTPLSLRGASVRKDERLVRTARSYTGRSQPQGKNLVRAVGVGASHKLVDSVRAFHLAFTPKGFDNAAGGRVLAHPRLRCRTPSG